MDVDRTKQHRQDNTGTSKEAEEFLDRKLLGEDLACRSSSRWTRHGTQKKGRHKTGFEKKKKFYKYELNKSFNTQVLNYHIYI